QISRRLRVPFDHLLFPGPSAVRSDGYRSLPAAIVEIGPLPTLANDGTCFPRLVQVELDRLAVSQTDDQPGDYAGRRPALAPRLDGEEVFARLQEIREIRPLQAGNIKGVARRLDAVGVLAKERICVDEQPSPLDGDVGQDQLAAEVRFLGPSGRSAFGPHPVIGAEISQRL